MSDEKIIERGPTDCWPWIGTPTEAPNKDAKMACRNPLCCNPRHVVELAKVAKPARASKPKKPAAEEAE